MSECPSATDSTTGWRTPSSRVPAVPLISASCVALGIGLQVLGLIPEHLLNRGLEALLRGSRDLFLLGLREELHELRQWSVALGLVFVLTGLLMFFVEPYLEGVLSMIAKADLVPSHQVSETMGLRWLSSHSGWGWFVGCLVLVLWYYGWGIQHGFFFGDDFPIVAVVREYSVLELLSYPYKEHTLPLFLLQMKLMRALFGVEAIYYNIALLLAFFLMVYFAVALLAEMGATPLSRVLFLLFCLNWPSWHLYTAHFYAMALYPECVVCALVSAWAALRWHNNKKIGYACISVFSLWLAPFLYTSGIFVPPAVVTLSFAMHLSRDHQKHPLEWAKEHLWLIFSALTAVLAGAGYYVYESWNVSQHIATVGSESPVWGIVQGLFWFISGGVLPSLIWPGGGLFFWYTPWPAVLAVAVAVIGIVALTTCVWRMDAGDRWPVVGVGLVILYWSFIVAMGRGAGLAHPLNANNYRYTGTAMLFLFMLITLIWSANWRKMPGDSRPLVFKGTLLLLVVYLFLQTGPSKVLRKHTYLPREYSHYEAANFRCYMASLGAHFRAAFQGVPKTEIDLPNLEGVDLQKMFPRIHPTLNLSIYSDFMCPSGKRFVFYRNKAHKLWASDEDRIMGVRVASVRKAVDTVLVERLICNPFLNRLFFGPRALHARRSDRSHSSVHGSTRELVTRDDSHGNGTMIESDGTTRISIKSGAWDPERCHILRIAVTPEVLQSETRQPVIKIGFEGLLPIQYRPFWIKLDNGKKQCIEVDMLQISAYSLNEEVSNLFALFSVPGRYSISELTMLPDRQ